MRRSRSAALAASLLLLVSAHTVRAQTPPAPLTTFSDLRRDGNGLEPLRATITVGFEQQSAAQALQAIATLARLNVTFDPQLGGLSTLLTIAAHERTAAAALIEVATVSRLKVRVSNDGQLIVIADRDQRVAATDSVPRKPVTLPAVRTEAARLEHQAFESQTHVGGVSITGQALSASPQFVEPDVLRSVQTLPGIAARSDYTAGFNVRGGEADQTLILLDGYPIYNPFHLGGVFSTFIDATVGRVDLRTGAMPAEYGGRLSGVLDVHSAEPAQEDMHGTAEVSLVSSTASVGSAFADGGGSWMIAARRTYVDAVVDLFKPGGFPYHFQDVQGHLVRTLPGGVRLSLTAYDGIDAAGSTKDSTNGSWGNGIAGATLSKHFTNRPTLFGIPLGDSVVLEQRASLSRYDAGITAPGNFIFFNNDVDDRRLGGSIALHGARLTQTAGYEVASQRMSYRATSTIGEYGDLIPFDSLQQGARSTSVYVDELWRATPRLLIEAGARTDAVTGQSLGGVSPRLSLKYFLGPDVAVIAAAGSYRQWIHSLGREEEPVEPLQFWIASGPGVPVSRARDAAFGFERWVTPSRLLHVEGFYKRYDDLLLPNALTDPTIRGDDFTVTSGSSYGADLLLRQLDGGPFSGWLSYTYAVSTRLTASGQPYFPAQDRRHNLNLVGSRRAGAYTLGTRLNVASGLPYTPLLGSFLRNKYDPAIQRWVPDIGALDQQSIPGSTDSARLPWYDRLDVSVTRAGRIRGATVSPYLSAVNLLNAHKPAAYIYDFTRPPTRLSFPNLP